MIIGGIDPGLVALGLAWGTATPGANPQVWPLKHAGIVRGDATLSPSDRVADIATRLQKVMPVCDVLFVECMTYRPQAKVNPAILLSLNLLAGSCLQLLAPGGMMHFVEPHVWKGRAEKSVHGSRIMVTLSKDERSIVEAVKPASLRHNALDAVGLFLYATNRLTPQTRSIRK